MPDVHPLHLRYRLQAFWWEHNRPLRVLARSIRQKLSIALHTVRRRTRSHPRPRVVPTLAVSTPTAISHPAIDACAEKTSDPRSLCDFLSRQTEKSVITEWVSGLNPEFVYSCGSEPDDLPPTHLESLLMAACAEDLDWTIAGWAEPAPGRHGPSGEIFGDASGAPPGTLVRRPRPDRRHRREVTGRTVPHLRVSKRIPASETLQTPFSVASGAHRLANTLQPGTIVHSTVYDVEEALAGLPPVDGQRTVLFLLPFLAIGGAEKLLQTLVNRLRHNYRILIATTDPHLQALGQTVADFRELTPHVYTLGDWLPREAVSSAIRHLLRRWRVESLVCWNGSVSFYDHVAEIKRRFPSVRTLNQLYNHRGGWIEHYCPTVVEAVDLHIAVNTPIARALVEERAVTSRSVATIFHGVEIPGELTEEQRVQRRRQRRDQVNLPQDSLVVGTFIRMHSQKRPSDVIRVARMLEDEDIHFLLVGGGPLDTAVDEELRRNNPGNITRLPLTNDVLPLYQAIDICLLTSSFEGLPVFLLDGLARAIPCVAPRVGDIPLLLEGGGGVLVETPGDIEGLASGIRLLKDSDRRRREGLLGRSTVSTRFGVDAFVSAYEAAIFPKR